MIVVLVLALLVFGASHEGIDRCELRDGPSVVTWEQCQARQEVRRLVVEGRP